MTRDKRFEELLGLIASCSGPLGPWGSLEARLESEFAAIRSLRAEDIPHAFDMIGLEPPRELWLQPDEFDSTIALFLGTLAEKHPDQFLATLEQRVESIPTAFPLIDAAEHLDRPVRRTVCELLASRRCLPPFERGLLREACEQIGCRCVFDGVSFDPAWRTTDVMLLATGIYEEKAFDRMPILADALQDAGCDNDDILNRCRGTALTHVRGCWALDLVLGKE